MIVNGVHISVDIETLGNTNGAPIVAIGACMFDPMVKYRIVGDEFYHLVDWDSNFRLGRHPDASTLKWWMRQSDASRAELIGDPNEPNCSLEWVLGALSQYVENAKDIDPAVHMYGKGSVFDIGILGDAYTQTLGDKVPWDFRKVRCVRTVVGIAESMGMDTSEVTFVGEAHTAINDARHQAKLVQCALAWIRGERDG